MHDNDNKCVCCRYDFFIVSQHVRQGTVSPTHYIVIHDESGWSEDNIQQLTYKMTHLYYNWPGTIRVPAPCQVCTLNNKINAYALLLFVMRKLLITCCVC